MSTIINTKRIRLLDILRGIALLGTLGTNIWIFANLGDISYLFTFDHYEWWSSVDHFLRLLVLFFVNGKFLALLAIMFGVGLEMKFKQSLQSGRAWPGMYVWICIILLVEGLLHFIFVMEYDILMSYAITAIIVAFVVKRGDKGIKRTVKLIGGIHLLLIIYMSIISLYMSMNGSTTLLGESGTVIQLYHEGSWFDQVFYRIENFLFLRSEAIFVIPQNIVLFLIGVLLMRSGAFSPNQQGRRTRRKLIQVGLLLGVPLNMLIFIPGGIFDFPVRYLFAPILSIGYIGLIAKVVEASHTFWLWSRLEEIGKMALSCYVIQNIVASFIFYGWGLGLGGKLNSLTIIIIWFIIGGIQLLVAFLWLQRYKLGPMENARKYIASRIINH